MKLDALTASERFIVEWQYRMLGGFQQDLVKAIAHAGAHNRERLRLGFPDEVAGFVAFAEVPGWWERVQERAEIKGP